MCPKALEQYSWSNGLMCPKAPGYYIQQYSWSNGLMCPKALGDGPKASVFEACAGDFQRKIPSDECLEDVVLDADYVNSCSLSCLIGCRNVVEKIAQHDERLQRACLVESCVETVMPCDYEKKKPEKLQKKTKVERMRDHLSSRCGCTQQSVRIGTSCQKILRIGASDGRDLGIGASDDFMQHLLATADIYDIYEDEKEVEFLEIGLLQRLGLPSRHVFRDAVVQFLCAFFTVFGHMFMSMFSRQQEQQAKQHSALE